MFEDLMSRSGLSLDRLVSFCQVAEAGGVTKAARGDPVRQSQFSRQIKELQEFFGVALVRRSGRGVVLTDAGKELHRRARELLGSLADFRAERARQPLSFTVAAGESVIAWLVMGRLPELAREGGGARFRLLNLPTGETVTRLREGTVDLAVLRADCGMGSFASLPLGSLRFSWFVPSRLLGSGRRAPRRLQGLASLPLAVLEGSGHHRQQLADLAEGAGLALNIQLELPSFPLVARAVCSGGFSGILPSLAGEELAASDVIECRPSRLALLTRDMVLAWSPRHAAVRTVVPRLAEVLAKLWRMP